jgi:hypothetical protein
MSKEFTTKLWESPHAVNIFGDAFHPGGLKLTAKMAEIAEIGKDSVVLDIACGQGTTACFLPLHYGCHVVGIDLSAKLISRAQSKSEAERVSHKVDFVVGDGESLPFRDSAFDAVISECSFSLLTNKEIAAAEIKRVLKPEGKLAFTDVFVRGNVTAQLQTEVGFATCIAGAKTIADYEKLLKQVGFKNFYVEDHSMELKRTAYRILLHCGSVESFSAQFSGDNNPALSMSWQRLFQEGRPGYALFAATKEA